MHFKDHEIQEFRNKHLPFDKAQAQAKLLTAENQRLRELISLLQAEIYASRLAAKYLGERWRTVFNRGDSLFPLWPLKHIIQQRLFLPTLVLKLPTPTY